MILRVVLAMDCFPFPTGISGSIGWHRTPRLSGRRAPVKRSFKKAGWLPPLPGPAESGGLRFRALIYDPKRELYPFLCAIGIPEDQIIVTHPFDARAAAWDLARDFQEPAQIEELTELLVPKKNIPRASHLSFSTGQRELSSRISSPGLSIHRATIGTFATSTECCQKP